MTPQNNSENVEEVAFEQAADRSFDEIDETLVKELENDSRLQSGIPTGQRISDLDFIQMSGLARPQGDREVPQPRDGGEPDAETAMPVSFFEKGVADVDAEAEKVALEGMDVGEQDIVPRSAPAPSMADLRRIIADLSQEEPSLDEPSIEEAAPEATTAPRADISAAAELVHALSEMPDRQESGASEENNAEWETPAVREDAGISAVEEDQSEGSGGAFLEIQPESDEGPVESAPDVPIIEPTEVEELAQPEIAVTGAREVSAGTTRQDAEAAPEVSPVLVNAGPTPPGQDLEEQHEEIEMRERDSSVYRRAEARRRSRKSSVHTRRRRRLRRWGIRVGVAIIAVVVAYEVFCWTRALWIAPEKLFNQASALASAGDYEEASNVYLKFARMFPEHPLRPEAQFQAAFVLQLKQDGPFDEVRANNEEALQLFQQFLTDNPVHVKAERARGLMGLIDYRLGRYAEAIELLRDPELRLKDPGLALPGLRTLARACREVGEYEAAHSAYLQAISLPENYSPEVDYNELAGMYQMLGEHASDEETQRRCYQLAIEQWDRAVRVPGIDPGSKKDIKARRDVLSSQLGIEPNATPADALGPTQAAPPLGVAQPGGASPEAAPASSGIDAQGGVSGHEVTGEQPEVNPELEATYPGAPAGEAAGAAAPEGPTSE